MSPTFNAHLAKLREAVGQVPQRQDSLEDQLRDLRVVASFLGMYDASDFLTKLAENQESRR